MPNWCYTQYVFEGSKDEIDDLQKKMQSLGERKESLIENGFGKEWLGNVVAVFGDDHTKIACRGHFFDLERKGETTLGFATETAWKDMDEVWKFVCQNYTSLEYYFAAEEPGNCYYATNDKKGKHFPERFIVEQWDECTEYHNTGNELFRDIGERTGAGIKSMEEMRKAIGEYNAVHKDKDIYVNEFSIIE